MTLISGKLALDIQIAGLSAPFTELKHGTSSIFAYLNIWDANGTETYQNASCSATEYLLEANGIAGGIEIYYYILHWLSSFVRLFPGFEKTYHLS